MAFPVDGPNDPPVLADLKRRCRQGMAAMREADPEGLDVIMEESAEFAKGRLQGIGLDASSALEQLAREGNPDPLGEQFEMARLVYVTGHLQRQGYLS